MKRWIVMACLWAPVAFGGPETDRGDDRPVPNNAILPELQLRAHPTLATTAEEALIAQAAKALDMHPEYARQLKAGLEYLYLRDYKGARKHFAKLDEAFPGTGLSSAINALIWQALMIENFDFRYNKQYEVANARALVELEEAVKNEVHLGWTHFVIAGLVGVEAIHRVRHSKFIGALGLAFTALEHAEASRKAAPDFIDLSLADGMYNYWRTIITQSSKLLPDFGDNRALGIQQIQTAETKGFFLRPAATLALSFSWLQERDKKRAIASCEKNRALYPNNVINNLLTGQAYISVRKNSKAVAVLDHLHETAPENNRAHYYKGLAKNRMGQRQEALKEFERYLKSTHLEDYQRSMTHYRMGQAYFGLKQYDKAEAHYKASVKANGFKGAKTNLARLRKARKEGTLQP
jgi:tetratricopeptide (TPR) repeat protein